MVISYRLDKFIYLVKNSRLLIFSIDFSMYFIVNQQQICFSLITVSYFLYVILLSEYTCSIGGASFNVLLI